MRIRMYTQVLASWFLLLVSSLALVQSREARALNPLAGSVAVKVRLEAKPDPVKAVGLVFSSTSSQQINETTITKIGDKLFEISFSVPSSAIQKDSVASAFGFDQTGTVSFANATPLFAAEGREILAAIPECAGEDGSRAAGITSPGTLQQLVDVRTERMNIVRFKIARIMDQNFLAKLRKFEEAFGLTYPTVLSPELPPAELIDRLSRIHNAVKKYQLYKSKTTTSAPSQRVVE